MPKFSEIVIFNVRSFGYFIKMCVLKAPTISRNSSIICHVLIKFCAKFGHDSPIPSRFTDLTDKNVLCKKKNRHMSSIFHNRPRNVKQMPEFCLEFLQNLLITN
jgi:hypothetical protein